ncbi:MAG: hypothetical protein JSV20_06095 [Candidatus Bathyarchaeota archaeon]|nr:MAG: hypothetical protein JSV20_06095 [Candidatus Bathyarchaeota archaeon]
MRYANRTLSMQPSIIRELLKIAQDPNVISFAGGMPSPASFPVQTIKNIVDNILQSQSDKALQYGATEGVTELREANRKRVRQRGINCQLDEIIITSGSQQALDLTAKIFLNPNDFVEL